MKWILLTLSVFMSIGSAEAAPDIGERDRQEIIENSAKLLEQRYVDPANGRALAKDLRKAAARWSAETDPVQFSKSVTQWLRMRSKDGHLGLSYSPAPIAEGTGGSTFSDEEMQRFYGAQVNHGISRIERLDNNIMLLDLRVFPPAEMAGDVFAAAMTVVAQGNALIIDLRQNGGGSDTANLLTGYLLNGGQPLSGVYHRPDNKHYYNVSPAWVPGRKFGANKPLYILTSRKTFSAAEAVAYDLQALGRAVIVGEVTGGGAHPFEYRRVHMHFALDLPEARSVNPITGGNWQGTGVRPDVLVPAAQALVKATELANIEIAKSPTSSD